MANKKRTRPGCDKMPQVCVPSAGAQDGKQNSNRFFVTVNLRRQTKACPEPSEGPLDPPEYAELIGVLEGTRYFILEDVS